MKGRETDRSMILTVAAAFVIVAAAVVVVCLNRFAGFFVFKPTEKKIARNLDFNDPLWVDTLIELSLPPPQKDFSIYSAFFYSNEVNIVTQVYATMAKLDDIRSHYRGLLENPLLPETNDVGVLELSGELKGRKVTVKNYFSEVSNLIQVEMEMTGEHADMIRRKVRDSFPMEALTAVPEIAAFASGESTEGYVMYNNDIFATDVYANVPLFSRAYFFNGAIEELKERIDALAERFNTSAVISGGIAEIKHSAWLYQVKALENNSGVKVALIIQAIPNT